MGMKVVLLLATVSVAAARIIDRQEVLKETLPAYAVAMNAEVLNSSDCKWDLKTFFEGVEEKKPWSLRMLDASGVPNPGFTMGNNYWLGSEFDCGELTNNKPVPFAPWYLERYYRHNNPKEQRPPFKVHYYAAHFQYNNTLQYQFYLWDNAAITLGLCMPASCTTEELATILDKIVREKTLLYENLYSVDMNLIDVADLKLGRHQFLNGSIIFFGLLLSLNIVLVIVATTMDIVRRKNIKNDVLIPCENNNVCDTKCGAEDQEVAMPKRPSGTKWAEIMRCFSFYENSKMIFSTKESPSALPFLHGIRLMSMVWIICGHVGLYAGSFFENPILLARSIEWIPLKPLANTIYSVDTYFFISGFLLTFVFLKSELKNEQTKDVSCRRLLYNYFQMIVKRYVRLTPSYLLVIGIVLIISTHFEHRSAIYLNEQSQYACSKYWWANVLYINNLFPREKMCMTWSWYLAADMQFYTLGCALLLLSTINLFLTAMLIVLILLGSTIISGYLSYIYNNTNTIHDLYTKQNELYYVPWVRIGPYIIGMITAYILIRINGKLALSKKIKVLCWSFGASCNLLIVFGIGATPLTVEATAVCYSIIRTAWGVGIGWVVIACYTGNAGIVNRILSFWGFFPFSRASYCAYLLNSLIIQAVFLDSEKGNHINFFIACIICSGVTTFTYMCSFVFSATSEMPYRRLLSLYLAPRNKGA